MIEPRTRSNRELILQISSTIPDDTEASASGRIGRARAALMWLDEFVGASARGARSVDE